MILKGPRKGKGDRQPRGRHRALVQAQEPLEAGNGSKVIATRDTDSRPARAIAPYADANSAEFSDSPFGSPCCSRLMRS